MNSVHYEHKPEHMKGQLKKILYSIGIVISIVFLIIVLNQLVSLYRNLSVIHPVLAIVGTSLLGLIIFGLLLMPAVLISKLPAPLPFPESDVELEAYKQNFRERLSRHSVAKEKGLDPNNDSDLQVLHNILTDKADKIIFESASAVFISTAISQNGKLDAFTVMAAQVRLIWKVAHIYWQRPSLKNLQQLYSNVALNALAANTIEQIDISQQIQPIISAILKSPGKHIPLVGHATHIITESILEGTVNAFLTLRVGVLTKNYCFPEGKTLAEIKLNSFVEASVLLRKLVMKSSRKVAEAIVRAGKNASIQTFKSSYEAIGRAMVGAKTGIADLFTQGAKKEKQS